MRNVVLALVALALGSTAATAQSPVTEKPSQGLWAEKLFDGNTTHDFGNVPRGTLLYNRFAMFNKYAVPLEIKTTVGCHCVTVTPSTNVLAPNKHGYIDVTMDTRRLSKPGHKEVKIEVITGPDYISTATLVVTANSRADVVLNPGQISFGVVPQGQGTGSQTIDVEYAGVLDWRLSEIVEDKAPLKASLEEWYRKPGRVGYHVAVSLKPEAPAGALKHELLLKTNDPASPLVPILVEATVQASLTAVPPQVTMGTIKVGQLVTQRVLVRGAKPYRILAVEGTGDGVTADFPSMPARVQTVLLKYNPTKAGDLHRQLQIKTDLDKETTVTVTVDGVAEP